MLYYPAVLFTVDTKKMFEVFMFGYIDAHKMYRNCINTYISNTEQANPARPQHIMYVAAHKRISVGAVYYRQTYITFLFRTLNSAAYRL